MRLFFALWPDQPVREALEAARVELFPGPVPGRPMRTENLHLTLHFIGQIDDSALDCYRHAAQEVRMQPFELVLDHAGYFPRPRVVWLGVREVPSSLKALVDDLGATLEACGHRIEARPFLPHLTLLRKVHYFDPSPIRPVSWSVRDFVLVRSQTLPEGARYQVIDRWSAS
ncbi:MAG: RNA 2',3'-cyclic phosphodiesterase [Gammaproteobacteria bacterium]|nr:RNA 2',3'-cyclic phosphodiesterase [Gammaproteobacteria bacterium]